MRELAGAVRGREDLVDSWREDLDRHHKGERAALGKAHADSARQIERNEREAYRRGLRDAERWAREMREREPTWGWERGRTITPFPPGCPGPEAPSVAGEGSSDDAMNEAGG